ncbi:MAG: hypothetical protein ABIK62_06775, partial [candidate division WOR-3 bacterium]
ELLDLLGLDLTAKIQIHLGGTYGNRCSALQRFIRTWQGHPESVRCRLILENDDHSYGVADCIAVHEQIGIPVVFDVLHHDVLTTKVAVKPGRSRHQGKGWREALISCLETWRAHDGAPIVDYSEQASGARLGTHAQRIDEQRFRMFLAQVRDLRFDLMLEVKDKERSALRAIQILSALSIPQTGGFHRPASPQ